MNETNSGSTPFPPLLQFDQITAEIATDWWKRSQRLTGNEQAGQLQLGKILVWCKERHSKGTTQKMISREYGIQKKIHGHTYACAKIFRAVRERRFSTLKEADYDHLSLSVALRLSSLLKKLSEAEIKDFIMGVDGSNSLRQRRNKDPRFPNRGIIYVMVTSAEPEHSKLGGSWNADPYHRAESMFVTGVPSSARNVPVWWEEVSDWKAAEKALHAPFQEVAKEVFRVKPRDAIKHCMVVGREFAIPA